MYNKKIQKRVGVVRNAFTNNNIKLRKKLTANPNRNISNGKKIDIIMRLRYITTKSEVVICCSQSMAEGGVTILKLRLKLLYRTASQLTLWTATFTNALPMTAHENKNNEDKQSGK